MAPAQTGYAGSLHTKTKAELVDVLTALDQDTRGLRIELVERLEQYLTDNEDTLREDGRFKGLYISRRKRRSPRGESSTPSVKETGTAEDLEAIKNATGNLAGKAYDAAAATYDQNVRPTLNSALEEGQEVASRGAKRVYKRVKEATGLDEDSLRIPDSPTRALRSQANQALENTRPVVENGIKEAGRATEHVRKVSVRYWRENGYRDTRQALRDVQEYLSQPRKLIKTMLFLELVYLLVNLVPWNRHELQFPPSQFSLRWWDRFLYACFSWMPEIKQKYYIPGMFVMFNPTSNAGVGFAMWLFYTVVPPFLLSHLISFLPQPSIQARSSRTTRSASKSRQAIAPLPTWDPLVFCLIRLALVVYPITSAAPDFFRYQLEAFGNLTGRALITALTGGFVLAHRLAALAE